MAQMTIDVPDGVFAALHKAPADFAEELRLAAAVKWYEMRQLSQSRAARHKHCGRTDLMLIQARPRE